MKDGIIRSWNRFTSLRVGKILSCWPFQCKLIPLQKKKKKKWIFNYNQSASFKTCILSQNKLYLVRIRFFKERKLHQISLDTMFLKAAFSLIHAKFLLEYSACYQLEDTQFKDLRPREWKQERPGQSQRWITQKFMTFSQLTSPRSEQLNVTKFCPLKTFTWAK